MRVGRVDDGNTQTDSLDLERQRGITIKSAVVSFMIDDVTVNLVDTPGHPDFIAEVERVLSVLDGAVLVVSAVEGVQAQTKVLMRALQRLRIPTMIFVNKIDRLGARPDVVVDGIVDKLSPSAIALGWVEQAGSTAAAFTLFDKPDESLADQTRSGAAYPIIFGSALTGAGVDSIMKGLTTLLPVAEGDSGADVSGGIFKIEREPSGAQVAYVRMFGGTVRVRDRLAVGGDQLRRITGIGVFEHGAVVERAAGPRARSASCGDFPASNYPRQSHARATFDKSISSTAGDFHQLTPRVLSLALTRAGARVCEPMHRFRLDCAGRGCRHTAARPRPASARCLTCRRSTGPTRSLQGVMPASEVHRLTQQLPGLTSGEGLLESAFDHYREIRGPAPLSPYADTHGRSGAPGSP